MCVSCAAKGIQIALQVFFFFAHVTLLFFCVAFLAAFMSHDDNFCSKYGAFVKSRYPLFSSKQFLAILDNFSIETDGFLGSPILSNPHMSDGCC